MNILLTGGTGFIGSHVLIKLIDEGHQVTVLARNRNKIPALLEMENVNVVEGSLTNLTQLTELVQNKEAVIHVALNYDDSSALAMLEKDTLPSVHLAAEAAKAGVRKFIYTSSTACNDNVYMTDSPKFEGGSKHTVFHDTKANPVTYYGSTKAASEVYMLSIAHETEMDINIIRPGYTFGNPAIDGAPTQADNRFKDIVESAIKGKNIEVVKNDGTQFIAAGQLAELYLNVLNSDKNRKMYFGLSEKFISWETVAKEAVKMTNSKSKIVVDDQGWSDDPILFDVSEMKRDFGLAFSGMDEIRKHLAYYINLNI